MTVKLIHHTPLDFIKDGIRMCWASQSKSDNMGPKDHDLIERIANKNKHSSVLRHSLYVFQITASTKTLLAMTRHKAGVDFSVQSTRYTTKKLATEISCTPTQDELVNDDLNSIMQIVQNAIDRGAANDDLAMLLPQAFNYTWQVSMNLQAIQHFCNLRTTSHAHYDIQAVAHEMFNQLPDDHKYLVESMVH